jgi:hypothetical protein
VTCPGQGPSACAAAIAAEEAVVVTDDADRDDEGGLVIAAQCVAASRWPSWCLDLLLGVRGAAGCRWTCGGRARVKTRGSACHAA